MKCLLYEIMKKEKNNEINCLKSSVFSSVSNVKKKYYKFFKLFFCKCLCTPFLSLLSDGLWVMMSLPLMSQEG